MENVKKHFEEEAKEFDDIIWKVIPYYEEDKPSKLVDQLTWLSEIGFVDVDVIWKYYKLAVYGGVKI